ncbi:hypothetical protein Efla_004236 [Eimeria flavescens]
MPNTKTTKRRGSGGSPNLGPSQKVPRTEKNHAGGGPESSNSLEQLKKLSTVVADSADFQAIKEYSPTDATTNPTLVLQAVGNPKYKHVLEKAVKEAQEALKGKPTDAIVDEAIDRVLVGFGLELLEIVPGLVSTEVPADLSFDQKASVERARKIIELYKAKGASKDRILIKVAATWEGIQAAKQLKQEGINCNITLLFSLCQAVAAADAGAYLVSPFVGRILDWHKKQKPDASFSGEEDPGVKSVTQIYNYFKHFGIKTTVMGASFRNIDEIVHLAGCDKLTIAPKLLEELHKSNTEVTAKLSVQNAKKMQMQKLTLDEKKFRWMLNEDAMATEKLSEGIRNFASDALKLKALIKEML